MLINLNVINVFIYDNLVEFLEKFDLTEKAKAFYEVEELEDIYEQSYCDQDEITLWLSKIEDRKFYLEYVEEQHCEYFRITELDFENPIL